MNPEFSVNIQPGANGDSDIFDFDFDSAMSNLNSPNFIPSSNDITSYDFDLNKNQQLSISATPIDIAYQKGNNAFGFRNQAQGNGQQNNNQQLNQPNNNNNNNNNGNNVGTGLSNSIVNNINNQNMANFRNNPRLRRESIAHTQGMGGVSFGSLTIGSWLKDEVLFHHNGVVGNNQVSNNQAANNINLGQNGQFNGQHGAGNEGNNNNVLSLNNDLMITMSPPQVNYLPNLEADYCKDYSCCGNLLPTLHDLLRHYEEAHISISPPNENMNKTKIRPRSELMEGVSTNEVFLSNKNDSSLHNSNAVNIGDANMTDSGMTDVNNPDLFQFGNLINLLGNNVNGVNNFNGSVLLQNNIDTRNQIIPNFDYNNNPNIHNNRQINNPSDNRNDNNDEDEICIDDPARHLYVEHGEKRPYKCPVIGCDKTYKNQNGLKYHKTHGHQNQKLFQNPDGTFSVIDPESNAPYPDGNFNLEKDKPYRCEVCGKRYKNLNGLKYHKGHTTH